MTPIAFALQIARSFFRIMSLPLTIKTLGPAHLEEATQLLASQFCEREPLCRILGLTIDDVEPIFRAQIDHVITQGLSLVAVNRSGNVQAVLTVEDQFAPFIRDPSSISPKLQIINGLLDSLVFPAAMQPTRACEVYYTGLAAVAPGQRRKGLLLITMILECYSRLKGKGYRCGFAKVTNARIGAQMKRIERIFRREIFTRSAEIFPSEFKVQGQFPFAAFRGSINLIIWSP